MLAVELKDACDLGSRTWCHARKTRRAGLFMGNLDDAYTICTDMSSALSYLAENNIIHDNIKALNILYSRENGATLIDFGLSYFVNEKISQTGGSPWYKDPSKNKKGTLGDIFSLGVVMLYAMGEIPLPEREPSWVIHEAYMRDPEALNLQDMWFSKIKAKRGHLKTLPTEPRRSKEVKLRGLVCQMLADTDDRISARGLAKELGQEQ
jgi:serine/threonine protein kinase